MEGPRPSSATAPSIWYAAVAVPKTKPGGKRRPSSITPPPYGPGRAGQSRPAPEARGSGADPLAALGDPPDGDHRRPRLAAVRPGGGRVVVRRPLLLTRVL